MVYFNNKNNNLLFLFIVVNTTITTTTSVGEKEKLQLEFRIFDEKKKINILFFLSIFNLVWSNKKNKIVAKITNYHFFLFILIF